jgi:hypothetical protein
MTLLCETTTIFTMKNFNSNIEFQDKFLNNVLSDLMNSRRESMVTFPRADYAKVLEMDVLYVNKLRTLLMFQASEVQKISEDLKRGAYKGKETAAQLKIARLDVEMWKTQTELRVQEKLVQDKHQHFHNVFLPNFNLEIDEMKKGWQSAHDHCAELATKKSLIPSVQLIRQEFERYQRIAPELENDPIKIEDFKTGVFKNFRRLLANYEKEMTKMSGDAVATESTTSPNQS